MIKAFEENIESRSIKVLEELSASIHYLTSRILPLASHIDNTEPLSNLRNVFKMVIFLALFFISATALKKPKNQTDLLSEAMNGKEKGRRKTGKEGVLDLGRLVGENQRQIIAMLR